MQDMEPKQGFEGHSSEDGKVTNDKKQRPRSAKESNYLDYGISDRAPPILSPLLGIRACILILGLIILSLGVAWLWSVWYDDIDPKLVKAAPIISVVTIIAGLIVILASIFFRRRPNGQPSKEVTKDDKRVR